MSIDAPVSDGEDELATLTSALDKANASLERAHVAHEALRKRLGTRAPPPSTLPRKVVGPALGGGAYRAKDELVELRRAVDEAKGAAAKLRAENAQLENECDMKFPEPAFGSTMPGILLLSLVILAAIGGVVWVLTTYGGKQASGALTTFLFLGYLYVKIFGRKPTDR